MRLGLAMFVTILAGSCAPPADDDADAPVPVIRRQVLRTITFATLDEEGRSPGFNLDGRTSDGSDPTDCGHADLMGTDGTEGVDNQVVHFVPFVEAYSEGAVEGLIRGSINDGRSLLVVEVEEDETGQPMALRVIRAAGKPLLGTDGLLLADQTLQRAEGELLGESLQVTRDGNLWTAGPLSVYVPFLVFDYLYELDLRDAYLQFREDENGYWTEGVLGGTASLDQLKTILETADERLGDDVVGLFLPVLEDAADLEPDEAGVCQSLSATVAFESAPVHLLDAPPVLPPTTDGE